MGMFDYVSFVDFEDSALSEFSLSDIITTGPNCPQTKSLDCWLDHYTVRDKKLYIGDEYIPFHGDMELTCSTNDGKVVFLVARFTEGELMWIKDRNDRL